MEIGIDFKVDDSKVHIIRGKKSLRDIAVKHIRGGLISKGISDPPTQDEHDLVQVLNWLEAMEI